MSTIPSKMLLISLSSETDVIINIYSFVLKVKHSDLL